MRGIRRTAACCCCRRRATKVLHFGISTHANSFTHSALGPNCVNVFTVLALTDCCITNIYSEFSPNKFHAHPVFHPFNSTIPTFFFPSPHRLRASISFALPISPTKKFILKIHLIEHKQHCKQHELAQHTRNNQIHRLNKTKLTIHNLNEKSNETCLIFKMCATSIEIRGGKTNVSWTFVDI